MPWKGKAFGWGQELPYIHYLPEPKEASIQIAAKIADDLEQSPMDGEITVTLSSLEPPSIRLVFDLLFRAYNSECRVGWEIERIPEPDPRQSEVPFRLWEYNETVPRPAVPPPAPELQAACATLALAPFQILSNWEQAADLIEPFNEESIPELLAVMVYPPPVQDGIDAWHWLQRIQLAAAQLVAAIEIREGIDPADSQLLWLLQGPIDWSVDAAIIMLTQWVRLLELPCTAIYEPFVKVLPRLPREGYWSSYPVLLQNLLLLEDLPDHVRLQCQTSLQEFLRDTSMSTE